MTFDVFEWAAPEFLEKAAAELLEEEWKKRSMAKLPEGTSLEDAMTRGSDSRVKDHTKVISTNHQQLKSG